LKKRVIEGKGKGVVDMRGGLISGAEIREEISQMEEEISQIREENSQIREKSSQMEQEMDECVKAFIPFIIDSARAKNISVSEVINESNMSDSIKQKLLDYAKNNNL
jgi:hypothetical protein